MYDLKNLRASAPSGDFFTAHSFRRRNRSGEAVARIAQPGIASESELDWLRLRSALAAGKITGPKVHDARIATLCLQHGVRELWSADRDFGRLPGLTVVNPLAA